MKLESLAKLSLDEPKRKKLKAFVAEFDRNWAAEALSKYLRRLTKLDESVRRATAIELVKVDLGHRWSKGNCVKVESYVAKVPELGELAELSDDLILARYEDLYRHGILHLSPMGTIVEKDYIYQ